MEPGTILSIVQLSGSILSLGSKVAKEFLGNDKVRDKLTDLNVRVRTFYEFVDDIIQKTPDASSQLEYPGASSIIKTLNECKRFLEQYDRTLSPGRSFGGATQRAWLVVGPDGSKLEDFNSKIDRHYLELQHWTLRSLQREIRSISTTTLASTVATSSNETHRIPYTPDLSPRAELGSFAELPTTQALTPSRIDRSPELRARSRRHSLDSIPELPSPLANMTQPLPTGARRQQPRTHSGPVIALFGTSGRDSAVSLSSALGGSDANAGLGSRLYLPTQPAQSRGPGHPVSLHIGSRTYQFNSNNYKVADLDGVRVVDWVNTGSQIHIRHFVSPDLRCRILYTIPNDAKSQAFFLPRHLKHRFEITSSGVMESCLEKIVYQFDHKPDRETFQRRLRGREYLTMVQATKIHSTLERDIARIVHLKVWRRDGQDEEPTFSFAAHQSGQESHHVEYKIRWFKKTPELRGENKLILRLYSVDSDLDYGPPPDEPRRKSSSTLKAITRRMSGDFSQASPSHSNSRLRSSSTGPPALVLYDSKGKEAPAEVRSQGDLEFEFANPELRKTFVNACSEAHRPASEAARRSSTPSPVSQPQQHTPTLGPNQPGPHELMGAPVFQIPPPSLTAPPPLFEEVRFNNTESLFAPPRGGGC
ncbi:hypothetical protein F4820DRAFT_194345 [Hypoxylon rubiginosum]|uniref:Uncharacterized protein n=1 Tax=Hypoxylon rubiginosum TaxID=110542 RepID=A0ACB9YJ21_9PEZI|nr:hypothetical protein F4820DRAFT_194345 [Hypoxylon rubiginosum]